MLLWVCIFFWLSATLQNTTHHTCTLLFPSTNSLNNKPHIPLTHLLIDSNYRLQLPTPTTDRVMVKSNPRLFPSTCPSHNFCFLQLPHPTLLLTVCQPYHIPPHIPPFPSTTPLHSKSNTQHPRFLQPTQDTCNTFAVSFNLPPTLDNNLTNPFPSTLTPLGEMFKEQIERTRA